jgi:hypothetical protein
MGIKAVATGDFVEKAVATGDFGDVAVRDVASRPTRAALIRNFMSLQGEKGMPLSVIRSNWLQVKEKGVMVFSRMTLFSSARRYRGTKASYWWWYACAEGAIR